jgi:TraC protein/TraG P-loop domain
MSISRITRKRLFDDEELFNKLLPFAAYDEENGLFWHADTSVWAMFELSPLWILSISDASAYQISQQFQEMLDSLDTNISVQVNWITTFDVDNLLERSIKEYPTSGPAGWMAKRWIRSIKNTVRSNSLHRRPRRLRLLISFRFQPPWMSQGFFDEIKRSIKLLFGKGNAESSPRSRKKEELNKYALEFNGLVEGKASKLMDLGLSPRRLKAQDLINILYPILNRRSTKSGKFKRGRNTSVPVPVWDKNELLANQISETPVDHPEGGIIKKDGRVFRSVSLVKSPKTMLPLMIAPLQSTPFENILTVTLSKDTIDKQLSRLNALDKTLGFREFGPMGRSDQKIQHQISTVRAARQELYNNRSQLVRLGLHQTFICGNIDEALRATSEAMATFPQLHGARGMVHSITDLAVFVNSLPGAYDPSTDGPGWTNLMRSSRAARLFPLYGNWRGSAGSLFVLPSLWNRELVGFDLFDSNLAPNVLISGVSGSGKSYLLCFLIIMLNRGHYSQNTAGRFLERKPITFIFDKGMVGQPCGFNKVASLLGGRVYEASPSKAPAMNFLARLGNTDPVTSNEDYKDLVDICADIICDMATEGDKTLDRLDRAGVIDCLVESHRLYRSGPKRREFILSDVISVLRAPKRIDENDESASRRQRIALLTGDYHGDGTYARFFDRPGALQLKERFIVFDLKALSRNPDLQRVFLKIAMLWADTVMNDPQELDTRKILVFDEAHDLIGKTAAGTIETAFRLYRKRKGIVIAASQSGEDFYVGTGGQAIVQNSAHKIFLRQDPSKFHYTAQAFNLSDQQSDVILRLKTVKGFESQFYLLSDIGEAALCLPQEPSFYWASTNNGDDNQLFQDLMEHTQGDFWSAFEHAVSIAPNGASYLRHNSELEDLEQTEESLSSSIHEMVGGIINKG